jgi:hypothetical protein
MNVNDKQDETGILMNNVSLNNYDDIDYTVNLRVIGMMCQRNCGEFFFDVYVLFDWSWYMTIFLTH